MSDSPTPEEARRTRRRWIGFGEVIGVLAVGISALGLWKSWDKDEKPTTVVEQRQPVSLTLRGRAEDDGRSLQIAPVEESHALQSLTITVPGASSPIEVASDGELSAGDVERAIPSDNDRSKGTHRLRVRIASRYVEAGADKSSSGNYVLNYRWESGGLFGGRSLRLTGLTRA
jgi:hypothetical protein